MHNCSRLYEKERRAFSSNPDSVKIYDNKTFWKYVQPHFCDKRTIAKKITLASDNNTIIRSIYIRRAKLYIYD